MPADLSALTTHFIIELHFNNSFANTRHCSPHVDIWSFVFQPAATWLRASKATEVLPIIHLVIQMFVAGTGMLHHAYGKPVLVQVVVKGHRKHDGQALRTNPAMHMEQVVGQQAHGARGRVVILREGAHLGLLDADSRLGRVLTEATCQVYPIQGRGRQICTIKLTSWCHRPPPHLMKKMSFVSFVEIVGVLFECFQGFPGYLKYLMLMDGVRLYEHCCGLLSNSECTCIRCAMRQCVSLRDG